MHLYIDHSISVSSSRDERVERRCSHTLDRWMVLLVYDGRWVDGGQLTGSSSTFVRRGRPSARCACACSEPCVAWLGRRATVADVGGETVTRPPTPLAPPGSDCGIAPPPPLPPVNHRPVNCYAQRACGVNEAVSLEVRKFWTTAKAARALLIGLCAATHSAPGNDFRTLLYTECSIHAIHLDVEELKAC